MLVDHAGPRLLNSSLSLDVRQLSSRSWASVVGSGAITREGSPPDDPPGSLRHASTTSDKGTNRKCTSSGALGSRMFRFSRAYNQQNIWRHQCKNHPPKTHLWNIHTHTTMIHKFAECLMWEAAEKWWEETRKQRDSEGEYDNDVHMRYMTTVRQRRLLSKPRQGLKICQDEDKVNKTNDANFAILQARHNKPHLLNNGHDSQRCCPGYHSLVLKTTLQAGLGLSLDLWGLDEDRDQDQICVVQNCPKYL